MANQHTKAAEAAKTPTGDDGPDLGPTQDDQMAAMVDQMAAMQEQLEAAHAALAARPRAAAPVLVNSTATATQPPPTEATYEPGDTDEEGVAYAATIVAISPQGKEVECTPKVFRTILAAKGYKAHPADANMHLGADVKRTRRGQRTSGANVEGTPEQATAARRRRRAPAAE